MFTKLLFGKLYSADFAVGYQPDINPFTEMPIQAWDLPDIVSAHTSPCNSEIFRSNASICCAFSHTRYNFQDDMLLKYIVNMTLIDNLSRARPKNYTRCLHILSEVDPFRDLQILNAPAGGDDPAWAPFDQEAQVNVNVHPSSPPAAFSSPIAPKPRFLLIKTGSSPPKTEPAFLLALPKRERSPPLPAVLSRFTSGRGASRLHTSTFSWSCQGRAHSKFEREEPVSPRD